MKEQSQAVCLDAATQAACRKPLAELRISRLLRASLIVSGIETAGDLASRTAGWLHENVAYAPGQYLGVHAIQEIRSALKDVGLELGVPPFSRPPDPPEPAQPERQALATCAMFLHELVPFGLPRSMLHKLNAAGIELAGDLACRTPARIVAELYLRFHYDAERKFLITRIEKALGSVGVQLGMALPEGWERAAREARMELGVPHKLLPEEPLWDSHPADMDRRVLAACSLTTRALGLSARAVCALQNHDITTAGELAACDPQHLLTMRNFGRLSVQEVRKALSAVGLRLRLRLPEGWQEASRLACEQIEAKGLAGRTLEDDIERMLALLPHERARAKVRTCCGWSGGAPVTYQEAGRAHRVSRAAAHAQVHNLRNELPLAGLRLPALRRSLQCVTEHLPCRAEEVLLSEGLIRGPFHPGGLLRAAEVAGLESPFELLEDQLCVQPGWHGRAKRIRRAAASFTQRLGNIEQLRALLGSGASAADGASLVGFESELEAHLERIDGFTWLAAGWFAIHAEASVQRDDLRRILSVTGELDVDRLRAALLRARRGQWCAPPADALLELCRLLPELEVTRRRVRCVAPLHRRKLRACDRAIAALVLESRTPVDFSTLVAALRAKTGVTPSHASKLLRNCPFIEPAGPWRYRLRGSARARPRIPNAAAGRPIDHGQAGKDHAWAAWVLDGEMTTRGTLRLPPELAHNCAKDIHVHAFHRRSPLGLARRDGAWLHVDEIFARHGAAPGDVLVLKLSLGHGPAARATAVLGEVDEIDAAHHRRGPRPRG